MKKNEIYQYQDMVLREKPTIASFKPNLRIIQNIKRIEAEIQQHQTLYDDQYRWIRNVINIRGEQRRNSRRLANYRRNRHISPPRPPVAAVAPQPSKRHHSGNVFCRILGPAYCQQCNLELKVRNSQKRTETYVNSNNTDYSVDERDLTSREKAVLTLLPTTSLDHQQHPGIKYFKRYDTQLKQYRYIPVLSSKETIKESLAKAAQVCKNSTQNESIKTGRITEKKHTKSEEKSNTHHHGKQKQLQEIKPPPNSLRTPPTTRASSREIAIKRRSSTSVYLPRTDLEWYHEISRNRGDRHKEERSKYLFDAIELATKLSALFRERYLPPERSLSRMSTVSSVDLDPNDKVKEPHENKRNAGAAVSKATSERAPIRPGSISSLKPVFEDKQLVDFSSKETGEIWETDDENEEEDKDFLPIIPHRVNMVSERSLQTPYMML